MPEDVFNLLAIRRPTRGEGMSGIEAGFSDPLSSPLPPRHHGGQGFTKNNLQTTELIKMLIVLTFD